MSSTVRTILRPIKLINLIGFRQAIVFIFHYIFNPAGSVPLRVKGIKTPVQVRTRGSDIQVLRQVFGEQWFDLPLTFNPKFIVDGGAYTGFTALYFANKYPKARILAIEPDMANSDLFRKNCDAYPNIELIHAALWGHSTRLSIDNPNNDSWMFQVSENEVGGIRGMTINDVLKYAEEEVIDILKLDIEGGELSIFDKSSQLEPWLSNTRTIYIELHDRYISGCTNTVFDAVAEEEFAVRQNGEYTIFTRPRWQPAKIKLARQNGRISS